MPVAGVSAGPYSPAAAGIPSADHQQRLQWLNTALRNAYANGNMALADAIEQRINALNQVIADDTPATVPLAPAMPPNAPTDALPPPPAQSALPAVPELQNTGYQRGNVMGNIQGLNLPGDVQLSPVPLPPAVPGDPRVDITPPSNLPRTAAMNQGVNQWQDVGPAGMASRAVSDPYANYQMEPPPRTAAQRPGSAPVNQGRDALAEFGQGVSDFFNWVPRWGVNEPSAFPEDPRLSMPVPTNQPPAPPIGSAAAGTPGSPVQGPPSPFGGFSEPPLRPFPQPVQATMPPQPAPMGGMPPAGPGSVPMPPRDALTGAVVTPTPPPSPGSPVGSAVSAMPASAGSAPSQRGGLSNQIPIQPPAGQPADALAGTGYRPAPPFGVAAGAWQTGDGANPVANAGMPAWALPAIAAGAQMMAAGEQGMSTLGALGQGVTAGLGAYASAQAQAAEAERMYRQEGREERRLALEELEAARRAGERNLTAITTSADGVMRFYDRDTGEIIVATEGGNPVRLRQPGSGGGSGSGGDTAKTREIEYLVNVVGLTYEQAAATVYNDIDPTDQVTLIRTLVENAQPIEDPTTGELRQPTLDEITAQAQGVLAAISGFSAGQAQSAMPQSDYGSAEEVGEAFARGEITEEEAREQLRAFGYE